MAKEQEERDREFKRKQQLEYADVLNSQKLHKTKIQSNTKHFELEKDYERILGAKLA